MVNFVLPGAPGEGTSLKPAPAPVVVVDDFLPAELAQGMRADIDEHFGTYRLGTFRPEIHMIWHYFFVPEQFAYFRALPNKLIKDDRVSAFSRTLLNWSIETLGLAAMNAPYLSMYLPGCKQVWHNDAGNGRFAFVYSLTRDDRRTTGGETLVMREGDATRRFLTPRHSSHRDFYETIAPKFNRLVIFDDRCPHAVERVDGVMDPVEGRFVIHGHLSEGGTAVSGGLPLDVVEGLLEAAVWNFIAEFEARLAPYRGPLSLQLSIATTGEVTACDVLIDRVLHPHIDDTGWESLRETLLDRLEALRFPAAARESVVVLPVMFGTKPRYAT